MAARRARRRAKHSSRVVQHAGHRVDGAEPGRTGPRVELARGQHAQGQHPWPLPRVRRQTNGAGGSVPRSAVRVAAGRIAPLHAAGDCVAVARATPGRPLQLRVPAALSRHPQRDGGSQKDAARTARDAQKAGATARQSERRLPVSQHLHAVHE